MNPTHEAWMDVARGIRRDDVAKGARSPAERARPSRQALAELGANHIGNWLPHRTLPDRGKKVDHVVEHAMAERSDFAPLLRVERLAWHGIERARARHTPHAACSRASAARRSSIVAKAWKILRI